MGTPPTEERKQRVIQRQHGLITREQLRSIGFSDKRIHTLVRRGDLVRVHPATFRASTSPATWQARVMAGVLSQGEGCVAGMRSAARLMNLDDCASEVVEVVRVGEPRHRKGVLVHQTQWLPRVHITKVDGIPATTATRTLLDLGGVVSLHALEVALESAIRLGLTSHIYLKKQLEATRSRGRTGCGAISHVLRIRCGLKPTESAFETKLFQVLRDGRLPMPQRQIPVYENGVFVGRPDFLYAEARVAIEALSRRHHFGAMDPARDAARRNRLVAAGYAVLEITYREMVDTPGLVVNQVAKALGLSLF